MNNWYYDIPNHKYIHKQTGKQVTEEMLEDQLMPYLKKVWSYTQGCFIWVAKNNLMFAAMPKIKEELLNQYL